MKLPSHQLFDALLGVFKKLSVNAGFLHIQSQTQLLGLFLVLGQLERLFKCIRQCVDDLVGQTRRRTDPPGYGPFIVKSLFL